MSLKLIHSKKSTTPDTSKLSIDDFILEPHPDYKDTMILKTKDGKVIGEFPWKKTSVLIPWEDNPNEFDSLYLDNHISMSNPKLDDEYIGRGLGTQVYKKIEQETGKTIVPDPSGLSDNSLNLHRKKGLGKEFGKKEYRPGIIEDIHNKLKNKWGYNDLKAQAVAKRTFREFKDEIRDLGLRGFKSAAPYLVKGGIAASGGLLSLAAEAASEGLDSENSGAREDMPDYWLERGVRDRDEQIRRARLSSFKKGIEDRYPSYSKIPSAFDKPEIRKYKEDVLEAKRAGTLRDNYVDDIQEKSDYDKFKSTIDSMKEDEDEDKYQNRFKALRSRLR